ncbi:MAG: hypothetical protein Kow0069_02100 [Promethearchaeota archaeon]
MFGRFKFLYKGLKNVTIDSKHSHIYLKDTNLPLIILRPWDIIQLGELVGSGSEDIIIWIGKTIGKSLCAAVKEKDDPKTRKELLEDILSYLEQFGFGRFSIEKYLEAKQVVIAVDSPLEEGLEGGEIIQNLYNGVLCGVFEESGLEVEGILKEHVLAGGERDVFEFNFFEEVV